MILQLVVARRRSSFYISAIIILHYIIFHIITIWRAFYDCKKQGKALLYLLNLIYSKLIWTIFETTNLLNFNYGPLRCVLLVQSSLGLQAGTPWFFNDVCQRTVAILITSNTRLRKRNGRDSGIEFPPIGLPSTPLTEN